MTPQGELRWGVKSSFVRYVRKIAAGTVTTNGGAQESPDGEYSWPLSRATRDNGQLELHFTGSVRFVAHGGFLEVDLRNPVLLLTASGGTLSIVDDAGQAKVIALFTDDPNALTTQNGHEDLIPTLTKYGTEFFGSVYSVDTAFDPVTAYISAPNG